MARGCIIVLVCVLVATLRCSRAQDATPVTPDAATPSSTTKQGGLLSNILHKDELGQQKFLTPMTLANLLRPLLSYLATSPAAPQTSFDYDSTGTTIPNAVNPYTFFNKKTWLANLLGFSPVGGSPNPSYSTFPLGARDLSDHKEQKQEKTNA